MNAVAPYGCRVCLAPTPGDLVAWGPGSVSYPSIAVACDTQQAARGTEGKAGGAGFGRGPRGQAGGLAPAQPSSQVWALRLAG